MEGQSVPEPDAAFMARLESQLRTMDQSPVAETGPRRTGRRARWLVAGAPIAALTAGAAAAAMTLLPHDPKPKNVTAADPGVTVPVTVPETTPSTEPSPAGAPEAVVVPTTVAAPVTGGPTPTTLPQKRPVAVGPASGPGGDSPATTAVTTPRTTETTVGTPAPTTTVPPAPASMTLQCVTAVSGGSPAVRCEWSQNTSSQFRWYRLWRQSADSPPAVVYQSDNRPTTVAYDTQVQSGGRYYYKVDVIDGSGNVIAQSTVVPVSCC